MASSLSGRVSRSKKFKVAKKTLQSIESIRPISYKNWNDVAMENALEEVSPGSMTIRHAAEEYGVPRSTLGDRASGCVVPGSKSGAPTYLSPEKEEELVQFLIGSAEIGYPKSVYEKYGLWLVQFFREMQILMWVVLVRDRRSISFQNAALSPLTALTSISICWKATISKNNLGD